MSNTETEADPRIPKPVNPNDGPIILLDMDGVCVNFVQSVCWVAGRNYEAALKRWPKGEYDVCAALSVPPDAIWKSIDAQGRSFWENLESYPWFRDLHGALCEKYSEERVFFATSPSWTASSFSGKILWLQRRFGHDFCNYVFTPHKTLLARPNVVLIDDNGDHVAAFNRAGGHAMLFPQPWNLAPEVDTIVEYCLTGVQAMLNVAAMNREG